MVERVAAFMPKKVRAMRRRTTAIAVLVLSGMLALGTSAGCGASRTTKTEQTVAVEEPVADPDETLQPRSGQRTVTTTTTTESDARSPGIIGSAFGLVWAIISFPFRVVGALF